MRSADLNRKELTVYVLLGVASACTGWSGAQSAEQDLPLSAALVEIPGQTMFRPRYESVEWEGSVYAAHEAAPLLMRVVTDRDTLASRRVAALNALVPLRDCGITEQLVSVYDRLEQHDERLAVIRCLIATQDPRAFQLLSRLLEQDRERMIRMAGAVGLAQWNIRRGVRELINLLAESCADNDESARAIYIEAGKELLWLNRHKGWGFPEQETRKRIEANSSGLADNAKALLFVEAIKSWFSENEHRFPDWKPGDPLPESPEADADTSDE